MFDFLKMYYECMREYSLITEVLFNQDEKAQRRYTHDTNVMRQKWEWGAAMGVEEMKWE